MDSDIKYGITELPPIEKPIKSIKTAYKPIKNCINTYKINKKQYKNLFKKITH